MSTKVQIPEDRDFSGIPISLIFASILSILVVIFAIQNSMNVELKAYVWKIEIPLVLLLFITLGIGVILTVLLSIPGWRRKRSLIKQMKKRIKELENPS